MAYFGVFGAFSYFVFIQDVSCEGVADEAFFVGDGGCFCGEGSGEDVQPGADEELGSRGEFADESGDLQRDDVVGHGDDDRPCAIDAGVEEDSFLCGVAGDEEFRRAGELACAAGVEVDDGGFDFGSGGAVDGATGGSESDDDGVVD